MMNKVTGLLATVLPEGEYEKLQQVFDLEPIQTTPIVEHPTLMEAAPIMEVVEEP